jgi:hypothetical protein
MPDVLPNSRPSIGAPERISGNPGDAGGVPICGAAGHVPADGVDELSLRFRVHRIDDAAPRSLIALSRAAS